MGLIVATPPADLPVSLDEMKAYLRIDADESQNDVLTAMITAATEWLQRATRTTLVTTAYRLTLDDLPVSYMPWTTPYGVVNQIPTGTVQPIIVPRPPLVSVTAFRYMDSGGNDTDATGLYDVDAASQPGRIVLKPGMTWPVTNRAAGNVRIDFTAGNELANVPYLLRQCVKFLAAHWYEHREAANNDFRVAEIPLAVESIVNSHQFPEVYDAP